MRLRPCSLGLAPLLLYTPASHHHVPAPLDIYRIESARQALPSLFPYVVRAQANRPTRPCSLFSPFALNLADQAHGDPHRKLYTTNHGKHLAASISAPGEQLRSSQFRGAPASPWSSRRSQLMDWIEDSASATFTTSYIFAISTQIRRSLHRLSDLSLLCFFTG